MRPVNWMTAVLALATATPAAASTLWTINDPDRAKAARTATEQALQRARADRSCYIPAAEAMCRRKAGLWSCTAENPARAASCGRDGRWKRALSAG